MKRFLLLFAITIAACSSQPTPTQQQAAPFRLGGYSAEAGSEPVGVIPTALLHDSQRGRDVEVSIEYPTRGGPFPLIVFSHGYGASNHDYEPLISYWTSNGYVCVRPAHADAGALRELVRDTIREAYQQRPAQERPRRGERSQAQNQPQAQAPFRPNPMEAIWEKEREPQWRDRVADVKLVLDSLDNLENQFPELRGKIDHSKIGVGGHSYGAFAAMLIAGVQTFGSPPLQLADPRVRAMIAMSPQGTAANRGLTSQSWTDVRVPAMYMTGTLDRGATEGEDANWRKQAFDYSPAGDKYFALISGARHSSFTGISTAGFETITSQPAMQPPSNPNFPQPYNPQPTTTTTVPAAGFFSDRHIFQTIKLTSVVFWDAYLKNDAKARALLQPEKFSAAASGVELKVK